MSLVGFRARNHPQQTLALGHDPEPVDQRATPAELFAALHRRFGFTVDAAALDFNAKLDRFWSPEDDGLAQDWAGERVWCNPPYSNIGAWVQKAHGSAAALVVMLLPANRTDLNWWHTWIEPHRDRGGRLRTEYLPGRVRFGHGRAAPLPGSRPPFASVLLIWGE